MSDDIEFKIYKQFSKKIHTNNNKINILIKNLLKKK